MPEIVSLGVSYRSADLVTFNGTQPRIVLYVAHGLDTSPEVRGTDTIVPRADGRIARTRRVDRRVIELQGFVAGTGANDAAQRIDFRNAMEELRTLFDPTLTPGTLVVVLEDDSTASIEARTLNIIDGPVLIPAYRDISIELEAIDPVWEFAGS